MKFKAIPIFRINDYRQALDFYVEFLGFKIDWEHRFGADEPVYMQVSRNELLLHLSENKRFHAGVIIFVDTVEIEKFHTELQHKKPGFPLPGISKTPWNTLQLELEDPFGNILRFNENL